MAEIHAARRAAAARQVAEAAALVPAELLELTSLIGPEAYVRDPLAVYRDAGVTTLSVTPLAPTHEARVRLIEQIGALAA